MPGETKYNDWEEAANNSKRKVAVGRFSEQFDILKPLHKGGYFSPKGIFTVYPGVVSKANSKQVDSVKRWVSV